MTATSPSSTPEATQVSVWVTALARALDASDKHVTYMHARFVLVRELLRQGEQYVTTTPPPHTEQMTPAVRIVRELGMKFAAVSRIRADAERVWNEVPPDMRTAARHLAEEMLPFALDHGYRGALGRLDNELAKAAQRIASDRKIAPASILRVDRDTYQKFRLRRGALGRVDFPVFTTPAPDTSAGSNGETGAHS